MLSTLARTRPAACKCAELSIDEPLKPSPVLLSPLSAATMAEAPGPYKDAKLALVRLANELQLQTGEVDPGQAYAAVRVHVGKQGELEKDLSERLEPSWGQATVGPLQLENVATMRRAVTGEQRTSVISDLYEVRKPHNTDTTQPY